MKPWKLVSNNMQSLLCFRFHKIMDTYQLTWNTCLFSTCTCVGRNSLCCPTNRFAEKTTCLHFSRLTFSNRKQHSLKSKYFSKSNHNLNDNLFLPAGFSVTLQNYLKMQRNWSSRFHHITSESKTYEETVVALNGLQSNAATILNSQRDPLLVTRNLVLMRWFLEVLEITQEDLKSLNIIHVAGTKGKGSTCAFTESILRASGYKTGFFSSPHLVVVRERIRINGKPLSQFDFVSYFWQVYNKLSVVVNEQDDKSMPPYFMFLTLMAFHVFLHEKVDVVVLEVGLGGEYDNTNIVSSPAVVGLTSIGIDHTYLLGDTVEKIAWQKAGILKKGVPAFTVQQPPGVLPVFTDRAKEKNCPLYLVPTLQHYNLRHSNRRLNIAAEVQEVNMSLALQLCHAWIERNRADFQDIHEPNTNGLQVAETFDVDSVFESGLQNCIWLGRFQKLRKDKIVYFLDGAHTYESIECCAKWFLESSATEILRQDRSAKVLKVLIFNSTRDRKPEILLSPLAEIYFDLAIFCTNFVQSAMDSSSDLSNFNAFKEKSIEQCLNNMNMWQHLQNCSHEEELLNSVANAAASTVSSHRPHVLMQHFISDVISCLEDPKSSSLSLEMQESITKADEIHVLVTGSLHLVGGVLSLLDPEMQCS